MAALTAQHSPIFHWATVSDITGRVVYKSEIANPKSEINLSGVGSGVYFVTVGNRIQKLIITQ